MKLYITNRCLCLTGQQVNELGYVDLSVVQPFNETGFLGSTNLTALMFIRSTFQCSKGLCLPSPPFLFAILIHRLELPWAILFPLRLKLRLGAEYKRKLLIYKCLYTIALRQAAWFSSHFVWKAVHVSPSLFWYNKTNCWSKYSSTVTQTINCAPSIVSMSIQTVLSDFVFYSVILQAYPRPNTSYPKPLEVNKHYMNSIMIVIHVYL